MTTQKETKEITYEGENALSNCMLILSLNDRFRNKIEIMQLIRHYLLNCLDYTDAAVFKYNCVNYLSNIIDNSKVKLAQKTLEDIVYNADILNEEK